MHKLTTALLALIFAGASLPAIATAAPFYPASNSVLAYAADQNDNEDRDNGDQNQNEDHGRGEHGCVNPAGHERGWCKHNRDGNRGGNYSTISGTVIAVNGDLAQFREDNGAMITINEQNLLRSGSALRIGGHYSLQGYFSNNLFVAQSNGYNGYGNQNNGYPGGNATLHGVITSVSGNRVTVLQGLFSTVTIDDQQALNNGSAQNLYVGRNVTAYGFWSGNTFYATSIG